MVEQFVNHFLAVIDPEDFLFFYFLVCRERYLSEVRFHMGSCFEPFVVGVDGAPELMES